MSAPPGAAAHLPQPTQPPMSMLDRAAAGLHPAYFSLVMATGIVSLAVWIESGGGGTLGVLARGMFWLNLVFFAALWVLTLIRITRQRSRLVADFSDHNKSVGFFTMVPGACVLGTQALLIQGMTGLAWGLWIVGTVLWAVLTYTIFTVLTVKSVKPTLADGISGGWLLSVVATQAVAVLAGQLAGAAGAEGIEGHGHSVGGEGLLFIALVMWLGGAMLYVWIIALIFYRYTFFPFKPSDLAPPYWINMGAMAISTLAGATLLLAVKDGVDRDAGSALVRDLLPFIKGATLLFWATATWWIPMLLILGVWRHIVKRFPLRYDPLYFGAVFPLGMYSVATARMGGEGGAIDLPPFLSVLPPVFCYVSLAAWALALAGMGYTVVVGARVRK